MIEFVNFLPPSIYLVANHSFSSQYLLDIILFVWIVTVMSYVYILYLVYKGSVNKKAAYYIAAILVASYLVKQDFESMLYILIAGFGILLYRIIADHPKRWVGWIQIPYILWASVFSVFALLSILFILFIPHRP